MTIKTIENVKIHSYKFLGCSRNGNPRYKVTFCNDNSIITGKTATDSLINLEINSYFYGRPANVTYHETKAGNIIFHRITEA